MKDAIGRPLKNGDLVIFAPQSAYSIKMAIVINAEKATILSSTVRPDGSLGWMSSRTGNAEPGRLFIVARRYETDDYESIYDGFMNQLEKLNISI